MDNEVVKHKAFKINSPINKSRSPSFLQNLSAIIDTAFAGKSGEVIGSFRKLLKLNYKSTSKKSGKVNVNIKTKKASSKTIPVKDLLAEEETLQIGNILSYMNSKMHDTIQDNMGGGYDDDVLNYQTGRFAKTVVATGITQTRSDQITVFYKYMRYPYATFDLGGVQYRSNREGPSQIIGKSVRELATEIVGGRYRITPQQVI